MSTGILEWDHDNEGTGKFRCKAVPVANYLAPPSSGLTLDWSSPTGDHANRVRLRWENEGWTAEIDLVPDRATAVLRLSATWAVQQFLLFRDMEDPDLWLATDGRGRWGEMHGSERRDLDGCVDIDLVGTPFTNSIAIHRLLLQVGESADVLVMSIDIETLAVERMLQRYTRTGESTWRYPSLAAGTAVEVSVDEHGLVIDELPTFFRSTSIQ